MSGLPEQWDLDYEGTSFSPLTGILYVGTLDSIAIAVREDPVSVP